MKDNILSSLTISKPITLNRIAENPTGWIRVDVCRAGSVKLNRITSNGKFFGVKRAGGCKNALYGMGLGWGSFDENDAFWCPCAVFLRSDDDGVMGGELLLVESKSPLRTFSGRAWLKKCFCSFESSSSSMPSTLRPGWVQKCCLQVASQLQVYDARTGHA